MRVLQIVELALELQVLATVLLRHLLVIPLQLDRFRQLALLVQRLLRLPHLLDQLDHFPPVTVVTLSGDICCCCGALMMQHFLILLEEVLLFGERGDGAAQGTAASGELVLVLIVSTTALRCRWSILMPKAWVIDSSALWSAVSCIQEVSQVGGHRLNRAL